MRSRNPYLWALTAAAVLIAATVALAPAWAGGKGKEQQGEGKYANLTALWWEWIYTAPTVDDEDGVNTNPILDTTGKYALYGQENGMGPGNKYIFLCGTFGFPVERYVTIPAGKALFFPVVNAEWDNAVDPPTNYTVPELRAMVGEWADSWDPAEMSATLDGEPLEIFRTKSPTFSYTVPEEIDSLYDYFGMLGDQFEGKIHPAVADGYWCYVAPLPSGTYTLKISFADFQDNTYYLTVE